MATTAFARTFAVAYTFPMLELFHKIFLTILVVMDPLGAGPTP
ncbi:MAG: hypothetical protein ACOYM2_17405 [Rectinemataceae bacterium]